MKSWEQTEEFIRNISSLKWNAPAHKEIIAGESIDAVIRKESDYYILIEITENDRLEKVRNDIRKLIIAKNSLSKNNIYVKSHIVINGRITELMRQTANENNITIMNISDFYNNYIGYNDYISLRKQKPFGSCIDIETKSSEDTEYIPVKYIEYKLEKDFTLTMKKKITIEDIVNYIKSKKQIVLLGEFGTGKSRCLKEIFRSLADQCEFSENFPLAIDLRDCSGLKNSSEILRRHYSDLGIGDKADGLVRAWKNSNFTLLLDGFDEIVTQGWSENRETIKNIRFKSLAAIRDMIEQSQGAVLICGREHYFSSNREMIDLLGIKKQHALIIKCMEQFEEVEFENFLRSMNRDITIPQWFPRRPLICNIFAKLPNEDINSILENDDGEVKFFKKFIDLICKRESYMFQQIISDTIKNILVRISRFTRNKPKDVGPITPMEIKSAFEEIMGTYPIEQASVILQRLVGLGRYEAESENRQFADIYLLDGLRGLDTISIIKNLNKNVFNEMWLNPLNNLGISLLAEEIPSLGMQRIVNTIRNNSTKNNTILISDMFSAAYLNDSDIKFNAKIYNGHINSLDISMSTPQDVTFEDCIFNNITFGCRKSRNFALEKCVIQKAIGLTTPQRIPEWMIECQISEYVPLQTLSDIKNTELSDNHKVLLSIIQKTFFQRGSARKEEALLRGFGGSARTANTSKIINILISENIISRSKGEDGNIYVPNRNFTDRMKKIVEEKGASQDPLWERIDKA